jgi:hypothetical protein
MSFKAKKFNKGSRSKPAGQRQSATMVSIEKPSIPFPLQISNWLPGSYFAASSLAASYTITLTANSATAYDGTRNVENYALMSAVYYKFLIDYCKLRITISNTTSTVGMWFVIYPSLDSGSVSTVVAASVQKEAVVGFIAPNGGAPSIVTKKVAVDVKKFCGLHGLSTSDTSYTGQYAGAAPAVILYWHIVYGSLDGLTVVTANVVYQMLPHVTSFDVVDSAA